MSVFGDFRNVWVQRFPGSDLPAAWEEDVRANLDKHKQKVAVLREELEKEEFYVEYLERLLVDVAKHKPKCVKEDENNCVVDHKDEVTDDTLNTNSRTSSIIDTEVVECVTDSNNFSDGDKSASITTQSEASNKDSVNQCISELSVALPSSRISRSQSDAPSRSSETGKAAEFRRQRNNTHPSISNYVTVIEVNGLNINKREEQKEVGEPTTNVNKKIPPIPPPKKLYRRTAERSSSCIDIAEKLLEVKESNEVTNRKDLQNTSKVQDNVRSEDTKEVDHSDGTTCIQEEIQDNPSAPTDDDEPYYDSVPMDGEYVYLQSGGTISTVTSGTSSGTLDTDTETATMTLPSNSPLSEQTVPPSPGKQSNYVNIDYFIKQRTGPETRSSSVESEDEEAPPLLRTISIETDGAEDLLSTLSYASSSSLDSSTPAPTRRMTGTQDGSKAEAERMMMYRCIIASIIESETIYVECLNVMLQYMKAIKATLTTSQPVISEDEFNTMFYKIPELHGLHHSFLDGLKRRTHNWDGRLTIGDHFRIMASNINIYGAFLHNYGRATDTVRKCSANSQQFADITKDIRLKSLAGQSLSLEDLLHKPVARVQKNALVLHVSSLLQEATESLLVMVKMYK